MRIGIDLDNTIIDYDAAFHSAAIAQGLVPVTTEMNKRAVKIAIGDDLIWQRLQGYVYGRGIGAARLYAGVIEFVARCRASGHEIVIVSHKTEFGHFDETRTNLREAARIWLETQGLGDLPLHFEATRTKKVSRIVELKCEIFIDDLPEVFEEPDFPAQTRRVLFAPQRANSLTYETLNDWRDAAFLGLYC